MRDYRIFANGINLQVREYEHPGETVIFLHYGGGNLMMWGGVVPYFRDDYRLILLDLRGHGKSDKPQQGYHIDQKAADVVGVMERLGVSQAHVVGSSMGAEIGLSLAANYPGKAASLVCEGAFYSEYGPYGICQTSEAAFKEEVARWLAQVRERPERVYETPEALVAATRQAFEEDGMWNEHFEAVARYDACEIAAGQYTSSWRAWAKHGYLRHYYDYRFEDYYRRVGCPVLMLPPQDVIKDEAMHKAMQGLSQLARSCQIVQVPGAVHPYGWMLSPQQMSAAVLKFLAEVRRGQGDVV
jgi:pimeloyl-ACP methyl ester carboxylesterase